MIVGGFIFLFFLRTDSQSTLVPLVAGFIGMAAQFVFQRETATGTARQVERGIAAGSASTAAATLAALPANGESK